MTHNRSTMPRAIHGARRCGPRARRAAAAEPAPLDPPPPRDGRPCAAAVMALGGGVAVACTGGTTADSAAATTRPLGVLGHAQARVERPAVKRLQRKLRVTVSGYYGPLTKRP